ncbi:MAG: hypothetical protein QOH89_223 [Pseudonocardiales bacterium]|nr:hypothetical protein [Pseudonocardiales bacterium]
MDAALEQAVFNVADLQSDPRWPEFGRRCVEHTGIGSKVTRDQAFDLLRMASQHTHRKVADIAAHVTETGALPTTSANSTDN